MILSLDVWYNDQDNTATVGGVVFEKWDDKVPFKTYTHIVEGISYEYEPGSFYKRELPCLLETIALVEEDIDTILIDGYVFLGEEKREGLGAHLANSLRSNIKIIGVAKNPFGNMPETHCGRGSSTKPVYVTSYNVDLDSAKNYIKNMNGKYRIPTLLKLTDQISRKFVNI